MSTARRTLRSKKACTRCSTQKRRCDRAMPACGLCKRLGQACEYGISPMSTLGPTTSPFPNFEISLGLGAFTQSHLKKSIIQKLGRLTPEDTFSSFMREVEPWFPIVSISRLRSRLTGTETWSVIPLDVALLCLSITLLTTPPPSTPEDENEPSEFKALYLCAKISIAAAEVLGINSLPVIQSRILVNLFEVAHGFYPAAYISIGATVRAADALEVMHSGADSIPSHSLDSGTNREETVVAWCAILVLDRFIAIESGPRPSLLSSRSKLFHDALKHAICTTHQHNQDHLSPLYRFSRLFEASALLENIYTTLNNFTAEQGFNTEKLMLTVNAVTKFKTILNNEIGDEVRIYAGGLGLCNIALLIAFENGSKLPVIPGFTDSCKSSATPSLAALLFVITSTAEAFTLGTQTIDLNCVPPFVTFLVYRAAAIVTERLLKGFNWTEDLRMLRVLRNFLKLVGERWLGYERYLKVLNEDTTPRILKAIEHG